MALIDLDRSMPVSDKFLKDFLTRVVVGIPKHNRIYSMEFDSDLEDLFRLDVNDRDLEVAYSCFVQKHHDLFWNSLGPGSIYTLLRNESDYIYLVSMTRFGPCILEHFLGSDTMRYAVPHQVLSMAAAFIDNKTVTPEMIYNFMEHGRMDPIEDIAISANSAPYAGMYENMYERTGRKTGPKS